MDNKYLPRARDLYAVRNFINFWGENPIALNIAVSYEGKEPAILSVRVSLGEFKRVGKDGFSLKVGDAVEKNYQEAVSAEDFVQAPAGITLEQVVEAELAAFEDLRPHLFVIVGGKLRIEPDCPLWLFRDTETDPEKRSPTGYKFVREVKE
jgi:hypothetical protein